MSLTGIKDVDLMIIDMLDYIDLINISKINCLKNLCDLSFEKRVSKYECFQTLLEIKNHSNMSILEFYIFIFNVLVLNKKLLKLK
jgi:hypothetical protein